MKMLGKIWRVLILLIIILVVAAFLIPYIYEDEIKEEIKNSINESVNAKVEFEDVNLSLFKSFPQIALDIEKLQIDGVDDFDQIPLLNAESIRLNADLVSILKSDQPIAISSIDIEDANLNIVVSKSGKANYDIVKSDSETSADSTQFVIELDEYSLTNSSLHYKDYSSDLALKANGINHKGTGNFTSEIFDLKTNTSIDDLNFTTQGVSYVNRAKLSGQNNIRINNTSKKYEFDNNQLKLNNLPFNVDGSIVLGDDIKVDVKTVAPQASFASFLSAVPNSFKGDIAKIDSKGTANVDASINGIYNSEKNLFPSYKVKLKVKDGYAKFPELSQAIDKLNFDLDLSSINGKNIVANIPSFDLQSGKSFAKGNFNYSDAQGKGFIQSNANADLDLAELSKAFPFEGIKDLSGQVKIDQLKIDASQSDIENKNFESIAFEGDVNMTNIQASFEDSPNVQLDAMRFSANPKKIDLKESRLKLGNSDMAIKGSLENPLAYFISESPITGSFDITSQKLDLNEWMSSDEEKEQNITPIDQKIEHLAKASSIKINAKINEIEYGEYVLKNNRSESVLSGDKIELKNFNTNVLDNQINISGELNNLFNYVMKGESIIGDLVMESSNFDINPFLSSSEATNENTKPEPYRVPKNMDINIATKLKNVKYQKMQFEEMNGDISMSKGVLAFNEVVSRALGGKMNFEGLYDSNSMEPLFSLKYDLSKLNFQKTFESLPFVEKLAGIMGFIEGVFNSTLVMEANLNENMFPNLSTLNAQGFIETLTGKIKKLEPLEKVSQRLGVADFKNLDISNTKNWFEIKNGTVGLKPEEYNYKGIDFIVSGTHAYNKDMSYTILAKIPRDKFEENAIANAADQGLQFLENKAGQLGININQGDIINLRIDLGGSLFDPKIKITPLGSEGKSLKEQVVDEVTNKINETKDTLTQIANEKVDEIKDTVSIVIENKIDTISNQIEEKIDEQIDTLQDQIKDKIEEKVDTVVHDILGEALDTLVNDKVDTLIQGTLEDILGDKKNEEVDKIKDKIKDWNPFKKKGNED